MEEVLGVGLDGAVTIALAVVAVVAIAVIAVPSPVARVPSARVVDRRTRHRPGRGATRRSRASDVDRLIDLLDEVGRELRTGAGLTPAVERSLCRRPTVLDGVGAALAAGQPLASAVSAAGSLGSDATLVVHALAIAARTGGASVTALDRAASVLRERRSWRAERRAQAAQARLGASIMTVVPLGFALWSALGSARVRAQYATSGVAVVLAVAGSCLNAVGWWWMRRITEGAAT